MVATISSSTICLESIARNSCVAILGQDRQLLERLIQQSTPSHLVVCGNLQLEESDQFDTIDDAELPALLDAQCKRSAGTAAVVCESTLLRSLNKQQQLILLRVATHGRYLSTGLFLQLNSLRDIAHSLRSNIDYLFVVGDPDSDSKRLLQSDWGFSLVWQDPSDVLVLDRTRMPMRIARLSLEDSESSESTESSEESSDSTTESDTNDSTTESDTNDSTTESDTSDSTTESDSESLEYSDTSSDYSSHCCTGESSSHCCSEQTTCSSSSSLSARLRCVAAASSEFPVCDEKEQLRSENAQLRKTIEQQKRQIAQLQFDARPHHSDWIYGQLPRFEFKDDTLTGFMRGSLELAMGQKDGKFTFHLAQGEISTVPQLTARTEPGRFIYIESEDGSFVLGCVKLLHEETCQVVLTLGELSLTSAHPAAFYLLNSQPLIEACQAWKLLE